MAIIDELLVGLGFEYDPKEMKNFKDDVAKTTGVIKDLARVAVAGATAITTLTIASTRASDEQGKLANDIGETVENVDALQHALQISGGSADDMSGSLIQLTKLAGETARGVGSGVEAFGLLGISVQDSTGMLKSSSTLFSEISQRFQGLSRQKRIDLADKLGVSGSLRLLQQGPAVIKELTDEARALGVTTEEDAKIAAEFQDSLVKVWRVVKDVSRLLSRQFVPILKEGKDQLTEWWKINRTLIEQNLPEWIDKITVALKLMVIATAAWLSMRLVTHVMALITLFKGLSVAALAANAAALLLPALIAAAITSLILLAQDAKTFFEGGDSFLGDMIDKFPKWAKEITSVTAVFATLAKLVNMVWDGLTGIVDVAKNLSLEGIKEFGDNLRGFLLDITGLVKVDGSGFLKNITDIFPEWAKEISIITSLFSTLADVIGMIWDGLIGIAELIKNLSLEGIKEFINSIPELTLHITGKFPEWADEISVVTSLFSTLADVIGMVWDGLIGIVDVAKNFSLEGLKEFKDNIGGFLGDITGISDAVDSFDKFSLSGFLGENLPEFLVNMTGLDNPNKNTIPELGQPISNNRTTIVDKIDIVIQGGADTAENIADAVFGVFQQTSQDLNTAVDQ